MLRRVGIKMGNGLGSSITNASHIREVCSSGIRVGLIDR